MKVWIGYQTLSAREKIKQKERKIKKKVRNPSSDESSRVEMKEDEMRRNETKRDEKEGADVQLRELSVRDRTAGEERRRDAAKADFQKCCEIDL